MFTSVVCILLCRSQIRVFFSAKAIKWMSTVPPFTCLSSVAKCKATNERWNYMCCQRTRGSYKSQIKAGLKPTTAQLSSLAFLMEIRFGILLRCLPTQFLSSTFIYTSYRSAPHPPIERLTSFIFIILSRRRFLPKSQFLFIAFSDKTKTNVTRKLFGSSRPSRSSAFVSILRESSFFFEQSVWSLLPYALRNMSGKRNTAWDHTKRTIRKAEREEQKEKTMKSRGLAARKSSRARLPLHGNDIKVLWFI